MLLCFGSCRIDSDRRQIVRDGGERHLPPKAYDLLLVLIEERPKVVGKEDLLRRIWPDAYVSDANLAVLVGDIRAAIGDSARHQAFIRTHHGIGYSFIADVAEVARPAAITDSGSVAALQIGDRRVLLADGFYTVGRDSECDITLHHASVSRLHGRVRVSGGTLTVEDAGSKNGTWIGGTRIEISPPLPHGQVVTFGMVRTTVCLEPASSPSTLTGGTER